MAAKTKRKKNEVKAKKKRRWLWAIPVALLLFVGGGVLFLYIRRPPRDEMLYRQGILRLRDNNAAGALENFRAALALNPGHQQAKLGVVRALVARKDFDGALAELQQSVQGGLSESEAALIQARIYSFRASHRMASAGKDATLALCDAVLAEEIRPAIELLNRHAELAEKSSDVFTLMGDLHMQESELLLVKREMLHEEASLARKLERTQEAAEKASAAAGLLRVVFEAQRKKLAAYERAIEKDPDAERPRLAIAAHFLSTYIPKTDQAKDILAPILQRQPEHRDALRLVARAERFDRNYEKALEHYQALMAERTDDPGLLMDQAETLMEAKRWAEALPPSEKLIQLMPKNPRAAYVRGRVLLHENRAEESLEHLQNIFFGRSDLRWPEARFELAQALEKAGKAEQAVNAYQEALRDVEVSRPTSLRQTAMFKSISYVASLRTAQMLAEEAPSAALDYARRAFSALPMNKQAFGVVRKLVLAVEPEEIDDIVVAHATALAAMGKMADAIDVCRSQRDVMHDKSRADLLAARLQARSGAFAEALDSYEALAKEQSDPVPILFEVANLQIRLRRNEEAAKTFRRILEIDPDNSDVLVPFAAVRMRQGRLDEAREFMAQAGKAPGAAVGTRAQLIRLYVRDLDYENAAELAKLLAEERPEDAGVHTLRGDMEWLAGRTDVARSEYDRARELNPRLTAAYHRALLDIKEGKFESALQLLEEGQKQLPNSLLLKYYSALALEAKGDREDAENILSQISALPETRPGALDVPRFMLAVLAARQGDSDKAIELSERISGLPELTADREQLLRSLASAPAEIRHDAALAIGMMRTFSESGLVHEAKAQSDKIVKLLPDAPMAVCWRIQLSDMLGMHEQAVREYRKLIDENPSFTTPQVFLVQSHLRHNETQQAVALLEELVKRVPPGRRGWACLTLAGLREKSGDPDAALAAYRQAMEEKPYEGVAASEVAWLLVTAKNQPEEALTYAERAAELMPNLPHVADTVGYIHSLLGDHQEAIKHLERARAGLPNNPTVRFHLGSVYLKVGRGEEAKAELEAALAISRDFPEAKEAAQLLDSL